MARWLGRRPQAMAVHMQQSVKSMNDIVLAPEADPEAAAAAAKAAGLRYVTDRMPGITRRRAGKQFSYRDPDGHPVTAHETLARLRALAIPPAWTEVWICARPARPPPGDRARCPRSQAVSLPRRVAGDSGFAQVRSRADLRPRLAADPGARRCRSAPARPAAREGAGDHCAPARDHLDPGRQRRVCARQQELRSDHHPPSPRRDRRHHDRIRVPRQGRQSAQGLDPRSPPRPDRARLPRAARAGAVPVSGR